MVCPFLVKHRDHPTNVSLVCMQTIFLPSQIDMRYFFCSEPPVCQFLQWYLSISSVMAVEGWILSRAPGGFQKNAGSLVDFVQIAHIFAVRHANMLCVVCACYYQSHYLGEITWCELNSYVCLPKLDLRSHLIHAILSVLQRHEHSDPEEFDMSVYFCNRVFLKSIML